MDITLGAMPELGAIISWIIVGSMAGSLVGHVLAGKKSGFGLWKNLAIGLVGAVIGGVVLIHLLGFDFWGLDKVAFTAADLAAAIIGAFVFMLILKVVSKKKAA